MNDMLNKKLSQADFASMASHYLHEGRKQENWQIGDIDIDGKRLATTVKMTSTYVSATDAHGFHLTLFTALEFTSELMIIYAHAWAGLKEKSREGWMLENSFKSVRAIRDPDCIQVEMIVESIRKRGQNIISAASYRITDRYDGLFEIRLKGFLS